MHRMASSRDPWRNAYPESSRLAGFTRVLASSSASAISPNTDAGHETGKGKHGGTPQHAAQGRW